MRLYSNDKHPYYKVIYPDNFDRYINQGYRIQGWWIIKRKIKKICCFQITVKKGYQYPNFVKVKSNDNQYYNFAKVYDNINEYDNFTDIDL